MSSEIDTGKCPPGEILRKGYLTKTGKKVKAECITAQSATGEKTSDIVKKYNKEKDKIHTEAANKFGTPKCPKGYILKEGYKTKEHSSHIKNKNITVKEHWTKPQCVKSKTGKSEKSPKLITILEKNVLQKYGYDNVQELTKTQRHNSLKKAIANIKPLSVYRRLVALSTLNKNINPKLHDILLQDANWIKTQDEYINNKSSSKKSSSKKSSSKKSSSKKSSSKKSSSKKSSSKKS